jgi:hypothetical protein
MIKNLSPATTDKIQAWRPKGSLDSRATATTLSYLKAAYALEEARKETFEKLVFAGTPTNGTPESSYRKLLLQKEAEIILGMIWKESVFVGDRELNEAGVLRSFDSGITQHGLAVALASSPKDVSALNSFVRNVSLASEHFGLIKRNTISPTRVFLEGTALLDQLIKSLAKEYADIFRKSFDLAATSSAP